MTGMGRFHINMRKTNMKQIIRYAVIRYAVIAFAILLVQSCSTRHEDVIEEVVTGESCEIQNNDTAFAKAVLSSDSAIRVQVMSTIFDQAGPTHRVEAENSPREIERISDLIESQQLNARRILEQRYCVLVEHYKTTSYWLDDWHWHTRIINKGSK